MGLENLSPWSQYAKFCLFCKKSVNRKPFLVQTFFFFFTYQNFLKRRQISKKPSRSFGGLQFFVRQQNPLFHDSYPSSGHLISLTIPIMWFNRNWRNFFRVSQVQTKLPNFPIFCNFCVVVRTGPNLRVPNRFFGIRDFLYLKIGIRDWKYAQEVGCLK